MQSITKIPSFITETKAYQETLSKLEKDTANELGFLVETPVVKSVSNPIEKSKKLDTIFNILMALSILSCGILGLAGYPGTVLIILVLMLLSTIILVLHGPYIGPNKKAITETKENVRLAEITDEEIEKRIEEIATDSENNRNRINHYIKKSFNSFALKGLNTPDKIYCPYMPPGRHEDVVFNFVLSDGINIDDIRCVLSDFEYIYNDPVAKEHLFDALKQQGYGDYGDPTDLQNWAKLHNRLNNEFGVASDYSRKYTKKEQK